MEFIGREYELKQLKLFSQREIAGLVVVRGRRRIGKSTLIEHFGQGKRFLEFYGLAPREGITRQDQLTHFGELLGKAFNIPAMHFNNWNDALSTLAGLTAEGDYVILLDEISWMASRDRDFAGKLKGVWDTQFKKNDQLILFLCGSVSSWIDENILNDKGFMGRVSLTISLTEMSLKESNEFWVGNDLISTSEKTKLLCVTGSVPRYLEEIQTKQTAEQNLKRICFNPEGFLFSEFDKIFKDTFEKRAQMYIDIVSALSNGALEGKKLAEKLGVKMSGALTKKLNTLVISGFISRDYVWDFKGKQTGLSKYRLKDNYLRFYLRYILPNKAKIEQGLFDDIHLDELDNWNIIMGYQFENLIFNNIKSLVKILDISPSSIVSAAPYFQHKTKRQHPCQIDLLIHTKHCLYVCEIKFCKNIEASVNKELMEKVNKLNKPNHLSVRPVLIYQGELAKSIKKENYFSHLISMDDLLRFA